MPVSACTGFEHGHSDLTGLTKGNTGNRLFDIAAGSPTMQSSAPVRTGTYALEVNPSAAAENVGWSTNTFGAKRHVVLSFWIRFPSSLPAGDVLLAEMWSGSNDGNLWFRGSDDKLVVSADGVGGFGTAVAGPTVVADTWYHVEMYHNTSASPHTLDWTVDGVAQTQSTVANASADAVQITLGCTVAETYTARYDDVVLWTDTATITGYPHGPQKVVLLKADTGGSTAEIGAANATGRMVTNSAIDATHNSANILTATSEVPPLIGATATGVGQRTSGAGNAVGIPMTTYALAGGESITGLRIVICGWAGSATANNLGMRTFNGTTETILFAAADPNFDNNTTSPAWLCKMVTAVDFDTQAELDALVVRLGYSTDIAPLPGAHAIYAELAVKESTAAPTPKVPALVGQYSGRW